MVRLLLIFAAAAAILVSVVLGVYVDNFGSKLSTSNSDWGTFGDYLGGVLNPVFALFAFFGALWSIGMQRKQLDQFLADKRGQEIMVVVKDIDERVSQLLQTEIGGMEGANVLRLHHMVSEAGRREDVHGSADSYFKFLQQAKIPGALIEAPVRVLKDQVAYMRRFLIKYPLDQNGEYTAIVEYYMQKTRPVAIMLNDVEGLPEDIRNFFELPEL